MFTDDESPAGGAFLGSMRTAANRRRNLADFINSGTAACPQRVLVDEPAGAGLG